MSEAEDAVSTGRGRIMWAEPYAFLDFGDSGVRLAEADYRHTELTRGRRVIGYERNRGLQFNARLVQPVLQPPKQAKRVARTKAGSIAFDCFAQLAVHLLEERRSIHSLCWRVGHGQLRSWQRPNPGRSPTRAQRPAEPPAESRRKRAELARPIRGSADLVGRDRVRSPARCADLYGAFPVK